VILLYHRIAEASSDPWGLCVSPGHFTEHLEVLRRHARPLPLATVQREITDGPGGAGCVAITFDDGYADNLLAGAPLLSRFDVPATVFVTTGYTGRPREFWWDALDRIFLQPGALPAVLEATIGASSYRVDLGAVAHYTPEEAQRLRGWRAYAAEPPTARHAAFLSTWERMVNLRDAEQWQWLDALGERTGVDVLTARPTYRSLTGEEIVALANGGPIEIGAHTVTHPALPLFPEAEQAAEIRDSRRTLELLLDRPVRGFAYPYGRYSPATVHHVRAAGFTYACAAAPGPHPSDQPLERMDPLLLPRVAVPDCDGDAFLRLLMGESDA
jgi:peptidoglycan/xylan/chitin deacetylase (PgdA/CDA1 family)